MSDELNPYAPPKADTWAVPAETLAERPSATMGTRLLNFIIDNAVRWMFGYGAGYALASAGIRFSGLGLVITLVITLGYYVVLESIFGWTVGKLITGTRVVDRTGNRARFGQIVGRSFSRWIPFDPLSFLGSNPDGGWHDRWSGTRVVRVR